MPRALIVDDHDVVRQGVRYIPETQDDCYIALGAGAVDSRTIGSVSIAISATYSLLDSIQESPRRNLAHFL